MSEAAAPLQFGRYEVLFRIAQGGMAEVFAGRMTGEGGFEKLVAIKRILAHLESDEDMVRMFLDEARLAAKVQSPHVVQTLDIGRARDGGPFLVMELVIGAALSDIARIYEKSRREFPLDVGLEILAQAALGLHHAHEAGDSTGQPLAIVHRDVSPQNVIAGLDGRVLINDFGVAHAASRLQETQHGQLKGKLAYMSPEQARGERLDRRSDVFSLGIVGWELLAGRRLFAFPTPIETLEAVRRPVIPALSTVRDGVTPEIDGALEAALAPGVEDRTATAIEVANALRECVLRLRGRPVEASEIGALVADAGVERVTKLVERLRASARDGEIHTVPMELLESGVITPARTPSAVKRSAGEESTRLLASPAADSAAVPTAAPIAVTATVSPQLTTARSPRPATAPRVRTRDVAILGAVLLVVAAALTAVAWPRGDAPAPRAISLPSAPAAPAPVVPPPVAPAVAQPAAVPVGTDPAVPETEPAPAETARSRIRPRTRRPPVRPAAAATETAAPAPTKVPAPAGPTRPVIGRPLGLEDYDRDTSRSPR